ncbi:hypothetical protein ACMG4H_14330 [Corynebacterium glutamicum]|uniref:hypothetical protein n=1 Tax=Corynebacterium glutamicum TaxID=1718 RepID=UPI003C7B065F
MKPATSVQVAGYIYLVTTFFQTAATVIPVLLVAGMLNPKLLRDYSRKGSTAKYLRFQVAFALFATFLACAFTQFSPDATDDYSTVFRVIGILAQSVVVGALTSTLMFVYFLARFALEEDPHPDRLENEKRELENRLAELNRKIRQGGDTSTDN